MSCHVTPHHIGSQFKKHIPGITMNFWQRKSCVLGIERSVCFDGRWGWGKTPSASSSLLVQPLPSSAGGLLWRACGWRREAHWRHIHTQRTCSDKLPALCLLMNGFFRHTGALRITKAEENKGTLGQAQTRACPGDKCLSQLERRHTSGEYGKIY